MVKLGGQNQPKKNYTLDKTSATLNTLTLSVPNPQNGQTHWNCFSVFNNFVRLGLKESLKTCAMNHGLRILIKMTKTSILGS